MPQYQVILIDKIRSNSWLQISSCELILTNNQFITWKLGSHGLCKRSSEFLAMFFLVQCKTSGRDRFVEQTLDKTDCVVYNCFNIILRSLIEAYIYVHRPDELLSTFVCIHDFTYGKNVLPATLVWIKRLFASHRLVFNNKVACKLFCVDIKGGNDFVLYSLPNLISGQCDTLRSDFVVLSFRVVDSKALFLLFSIVRFLGTILSQWLDCIMFRGLYNLSLAMFVN